MEPSSTCRFTFRDPSRLSRIWKSWFPLQTNLCCTLKSLSPILAGRVAHLLRSKRWGFFPCAGGRVPHPSFLRVRVMTFPGNANLPIGALLAGGWVAHLFPSKRWGCFPCAGGRVPHPSVLRVRVLTFPGNANLPIGALLAGRLGGPSFPEHKVGIFP